MKQYVIDTSVAVKWFVPESGFEQAVRLLHSLHLGRKQFFAPDIVVAEFGSALISKIKEGEILEEEAIEMMSNFITIPMLLVATSTLASTAIRIAINTKASIYDSLYLAVAQEMDAVVVTADQRLVNKVAPTSLATLVVELSKLEL